MIVCHLLETEKEAICALKEFVYDKPQNIKYVFADIRNTVVTLDGNEHIFMGARKYSKWNLGRTYMLNGNMMHSNFKLKEQKNG